jgi:GT2 family glycosyltransferase
LPPGPARPELTTYEPAVPLSAVVVNWNGRAHLETCLASLLGQALENLEVILVDNGSTDDSLEFVRARFDGAVRVVALADNRGYAGGLNAGIAAARGRMLLALNNDTELDPQCCARLLAAADAHPSTGLFAPKILDFERRTVIDNIGHWLYADGLSRGRGRLEVDRGQYDAEEEIGLASGCAVLLRRAMLADIGLFDEDLFAYCDDTDLGLRARLAGWRCRAVPSAVVYHKYSAASSAYSPLNFWSSATALGWRSSAYLRRSCSPAPSSPSCASAPRPGGR